MSRQSSSSHASLDDVPVGQHGPAPVFDWREWLAFVGCVLGTALFVSIVLGAIVLIVTTQAMAQTAAPRLASVNAADRAMLLFKTSEGLVAAPLVNSEVAIDVTGPLVRTRVTQTFRNPHEQWFEGVYAFPLPDDSAVDRLRMQVGDRVIEGLIREREAARREYQQAADQGRRASLVEQQRPNLFTTRVANIAPGADIAVTIEYQQTLALKDGHWRLRLPTVVAPRYRRDDDPAAALPVMPVLAGPAESANARGGTSSVAATDVPNSLRLEVALDAGVPITAPVSSTHAIDVRSSGTDRYQVRLADRAVADRDFELDWQPRPGTAPAAGLRVEQHGEHFYGLLMLSPPIEGSLSRKPMPRETTFIIDTSGSMAGSSFEQAIRALKFGIAQLQPGDRFNIIQFNSRHSSLFAAPEPFDERRQRAALAWISRLKAQGGTEMRGAIEQALAAPTPAGLIGQIIFMTDGAVDYEADMLALIQTRLGERRFFTIGIGSAPNGWFMRKAAEAGRGSFTYVGHSDDVEQRISALYAKLARPLLTEVQVRFDGAEPLEPLPPLGELYAGEPIVVRARFAAAPKGVTVSGRAGGIRWESRVPAQRVAPGSLHVAWARARIEQLGDEITRLGAAPQRGPDTVEALRTQIRDLGLSHHLITAYTSLVAVDVTPVRAAAAELRSGQVPTQLPAGWEFDAVFGDGSSELGRGATPGTLRIAIGLLLLALAGLPALRAQRAQRAGRQARRVTLSIRSRA